MSIQNRPKMPQSQLFYGELVYWITILACIVCMIGPVISLAWPERNIMNPYNVFNAIFQGNSAEQIWQEVGGGFPGGHFYLSHITYGDGFAQFGLALGCSVAVWALIGTIVAYLRKKEYLLAILGFWVTLLVLLSMTGIVGGQH